MSMDRFQALRVFVAVLDERSLSAAAEKLGISLPTVSRILSGLERELGVKLIARSARGIAETDGGSLYYRRAQKILAEVAEADSAVQSHSQVPVGELRVTAPVTFGRYHVAPSVAEFLERYPRLSFYLSLTDRCEPLPEQRLDVAIRIAIVRIQAVTVRRLGYIQRVVVGSRDYFERHPTPAHPQDLSGHNCLHFTYYQRADEWNFRDHGRPVSVRVRGRLRADNQEALLDAVLAGAGLAVLPTWLIKDHLADGRLLRVLTQFEAARTPVYAVFPRRGPPPHKVRAFINFLADRYQAEKILASEDLIEPMQTPQTS
ncbi:MAG: LysR family transcriptional regulator [Proteobacteria bacterium]|nr:LysR family transcriptional regulator [Pseudomonadota bacterium]